MAETASPSRKIVRRRPCEPAFSGRSAVIMGNSTLTPLGICGRGHYDRGTMRWVRMVLMSEGRRWGFAWDAPAALVNRTLAVQQVNSGLSQFSVANAVVLALVCQG